MIITTVFRTAWTADNVHIADERGHLHRNYFAAQWVAAHKPQGFVDYCERCGVEL